MKKRKRKPGELGQATTMTSNEMTPNMRLDGPHPSPTGEDSLVKERPPSAVLSADKQDETVDLSMLDAEAASLPLEPLTPATPNEANGLSLVAASEEAAPAAIPVLDIPPGAAPAPPAIVVNAASKTRLLPPLQVSSSRVVSPASASLPMGVSAPEEVLSPLEERVRKLEAALAELQDTKQLETRVAARVSDQIAQELAPAAGTTASAGLVEIGKRLLHAIQPPPLQRPLSPRPAGKRLGWLFLELLAEARVILRMYVDPRYRMTWVGRVVPILMLVLFLGAEFVIALVPILGLLLLKIPYVGALLTSAVQLVFAFILFKVLGHEARRYRELTPDLPPSLRL